MSTLTSFDATHPALAQFKLAASEPHPAGSLAAALPATFWTQVEAILGPLVVMAIQLIASQITNVVTPKPAPSPTPGPSPAPAPAPAPVPSAAPGDAPAFPADSLAAAIPALFWTQIATILGPLALTLLQTIASHIIGNLTPVQPAAAAPAP